MTELKMPREDLFLSVPKNGGLGNGNWIGTFYGQGVESCGMVTPLLVCFIAIGVIGKVKVELSRFGAN